MIYYRRYIGAYVKRTTRLSMRDHGAYCLMLDFYYAEEQPLPIEVEEVYDICKVRTPDDRKSVDKVLRLFFKRESDGYHNERADEEIAASQQARMNGKKGGRKRTGDITDHGTGDVTGTETGPATEDETETGTGTITGSGHPSTFNHSAVQPFSPPTNQPTTDSAAETGNATPPPRRAAAIAVLIRNLEKARNKAPKITSVMPIVQGWADKGVTDEQVTEAYELAVADRLAAGEDQPINAGFLDVFLAKLLNPKPGATRVNGHRKPWFIDSWSAIVAKGAELGLEQRRDEADPAYRQRVFKAAGVTEDQVRRAETDWRNAA